MKGCSGEVPLLTVRARPPSEERKCQFLFQLFPVVYTKQEGREKSETSKGMKKMGLKFDLSVA